MKDVVGYEGLYAVTSCGKVWSYRRKKFLKPQKDRYGYLRVFLCKDGKQKMFKLHRLVALAYIPNPQNLKTVDHINGNKEHNYINNLRWMSLTDNIRKERNKKVRCIETNEVFDSIKIAAKEKGANEENISKVCYGERKTTGGYHFEFV